MKKVYLTLCLLVTLVLSVGCTTAFASDWYYIGTSDDGTESVYIDNSSVEKNNRGAIIGEKWINSDNTMSLQRVYYTRKPKTFTMLSYTRYDARGNILYSEDIPSYEQTSEAVRPDTMAETIWYCIWSY